nr:glycosyltransferase family 39 protein [Roseibium sp. RKSG952]
MLRQPPLYEWVLWSAQQVFGPTIWAALFVKYALISLAALFLFLIARKAIPEPKTAALCIFSYSLFYQFGWNLHEGVTQTVVLTTACAASAFFMIKALETRHLGHYALFGAAVGAGLLSKHSYPVFVIAILAAAASDAAWRGRFRLSGLALVPVVALIAYSPYLYWILSDGLNLAASMEKTMGVEAATPHWLRAGEGLGKLVFAIAGFSVPLVPVLALLFWQRYAGRKPAPLSPVTDVARLCGRTVLIMVVLTALLIAATGATYVKERHMHPLLLLLPVYLFADLARFEWHRQWRILGAVIAGVAVVVFLLRVPGFVAPDKFWCGGKCRQMKPYEALKDPLAALGASNATLIADNGYTGGNLRVLFPGARIVAPNIPARTPARARCFYVWEQGNAKPQTPALRRFGQLSQKAGIGEPALKAEYVEGNWPHLWKPEGWRKTWWGIAELNPDDPACL